MTLAFAQLALTLTGSCEIRQGDFGLTGTCSLAQPPDCDTQTGYLQRDLEAWQESARKLDACLQAKDYDCDGTPDALTCREHCAGLLAIGGLFPAEHTECSTRCEDRGL